MRIKLGPGQISIEDSGPGTGLSVRERLFERFVHGRKDSNEGTGLGLSIVKRVVDHLGGKFGWNSASRKAAASLSALPAFELIKTRPRLVSQYRQALPRFLG